MELQVGSKEALYQIMLARYYSSSLGRFMAVDPGNDTQLENPQSWNKYTYSRNNPLLLKDPDGRTVINSATDPFTHLALDDLAANSATFQMLMDDPHVVVDVGNINYSPNGSSTDNLMADGGMANLQFDPAAGTSQIDVSIAPKLAGAASSLTDPTLEQGSYDAVDRIVRFEVALGVLSQADPVGTAQAVNKGSGGHPLPQERTGVANRMSQERDATRTRGHLNTGTFNGGPQTPGQQAKVIVDGVDVSYVH